MEESLRRELVHSIASRSSRKAAANSGMPLWQDRVYIGLARTASDATEYFQIPTGRVVEIGTQVAI